MRIKIKIPSPVSRFWVFLGGGGNFDEILVKCDGCVAECGADSTVSHAATSTQTTVATIKKKIQFDDATGAFTKLAMGKKIRTVNPRVPPNSGAHAKDDGSNSASKLLKIRKICWKFERKFVENL